ncbi:hypothetical protein GYMLUDRAFT_82765 [Collybiopsis luxurians FD-317 M1]|nr:hypothetical protein GYMLUDRAFT_82765 [Collybiopsis luxurians FD-317 M1]
MTEMGGRESIDDGSSEVSWASTMLPPELFLSVFSLSDKLTLTRVCLVSKEISLLAAEVLYANVTLPCTVHESASANIVKHSFLCSRNLHLVRFLSFKGPVWNWIGHSWINIHDVLIRLPQLQTLKFSTGPPPEIPAYPTDSSKCPFRLRTLCIDHQSSLDDPLVQFLEYQTELRELCLPSVHRYSKLLSTGALPRLETLTAPWSVIAKLAADNTRPLRSITVSFEIRNGPAITATDSLPSTAPNAIETLSIGHGPLLDLSVDGKIGKVFPNLRNLSFMAGIAWGQTRLTRVGEAFLAIISSCTNLKSFIVEIDLYLPDIIYPARVEPFAEEDAIRTQFATSYIQHLSQIVISSTRMVNSPLQLFAIRIDALQNSSVHVIRRTFDTQSEEKMGWVAGDFTFPHRTTWAPVEYDDGKPL